MGLAIREFGIADELMVGEMLDAVSDGWVDRLAPGASGPRAFIADPKSFMFGAYFDQEPVGFAWGNWMRYPSGAVASYLHELEVLEPHRRQGIATMLVDAAIGLARRNGHAKFWLSTGSHNAGARALYAQLGGEAKTDGDMNFWWDLR